MKTAIIKTDFWKEEKIFELLPDARYFYLCLLTNPERNATPAFKCSDRLIMAYTGYNQDTIKLCKEQLVAKGFIEIVEGCYVVNQQDYVTLSKGKLSSKLYDKEFLSLPLEVQKLLLSRTGATQERNSNSISKGNSNGNGLVIVNDTAANLATALQTSIKANYPFLKKEPTEKEINRWAIDIEKINRIDGYEYPVIALVLKWSQDHDFWKTNIRSGSKFRKQFERLLISMKADKDKQEQHGVTMI